MSTDRGMDKEINIYIYACIYIYIQREREKWGECYSAIKKDGLRPCAATWMDLESVVPSEVEEIYHMTSLTRGI